MQKNTLQELYRGRRESVRATGLDETTAISLYQNYIQFVIQSAAPPASLLDVGCGSGWTSYLFCQAGYNVTGLDLNATAFECPNHPNLRLVEGSSMDLPYAEATFDVVASHQALEHMPDPERAIREMLRVLKPGGTFCVVGPNLLSLLQLLRGISIYVWRNRPLTTIFWRSATMPKHPWGNTLPEMLGSVPSLLGLIWVKTLDSKATFSMREPDLTPPFEADNDACYLCNPLDFQKFLPTQNCQIRQNGFYGRSKFTSLIASGTYIAARKQ
ncbi:MAG: class I SAM-dependent methyltransferase [Aphanocapsa sp. GSE-SYN-MK-11-07L]|jgi:SAM-dependent methyltransferase|nr:class I SAM-dependent methyltransferase [Aphanocapsa sp. GSE-SYN-MK-11-07L]